MSPPLREDRNYPPYDVAAFAERLLERQFLGIHAAEYATPHRIEAYTTQPDYGPVAYHHEAIQVGLGTWLDDEIVAVMHSESR